MSGQQSPDQFPSKRLVLSESDNASSFPDSFTQHASTLPDSPTSDSTQFVNSGNPVNSANSINPANSTARPRLNTTSVPSMPRMPRVAPPELTKKDWRKDPAYKFLFIAIGVVLLASILFVLFAGTAFSSLFNQSGNQSGAGTTQSSPGGSVQGTVDTQPTFPTPGGNVGSTPTSQPTVSPSPTTAPNPTPTAQPSPTPTRVPQLTLQIVNSPGQANNGSQILIGVAANQSGVQVHLSITYDGGNGINDVSPRKTDSTGHATFQWVVLVYSSSPHNPVYAHITATAQNQNGQQVSSQTVTVKINVHGGQFGG